MLKIDPSFTGLWQEVKVAEAIKSKRKREGLK